MNLPIIISLYTSINKFSFIYVNFVIFSPSYLFKKMQKKIKE